MKRGTLSCPSDTLGRPIAPRMSIIATYKSWPYLILNKLFLYPSIRKL